MRTAFNSGGRVDATTLVVPAPRDWLASLLAPYDLILSSQGDQSTHPLTLDLWHIEQGRIELGPWDQHAVFRRVGELWGAWLGFGASVGGALGQTWSARAARNLGTYDEVMVSVPDVVRRGDPANREHTLVLGMLSSSAIAVWGDRMLGCGYRKRLASIERAGDALFTAADEEDFALRAEIEGRDGWRAASEYYAALAPWRRYFEQPLLGRLDEDRLALTHLQRGLSDPGVTARPVAVALRLGEGPLIGPLSGTHAVAPLTTGTIFGALQLRRFMLRVTYPTVVSTRGER